LRRADLPFQEFCQLSIRFIISDGQARKPNLTRKKKTKKKKKKKKKYCSAVGYAY
jgi:hypothetical protein